MNEKDRKILASTKFKADNQTDDDKHIIYLSGAISAPTFLSSDVINLDVLKENMEGAGSKDIVVKLNSPGGDVFVGIEIYNYLLDLENHVTVEVTALAASAASLVTMAADEVVIRNGASLMIHEAATIALGNKADIQKTLNALETIDESIVDIYEARTGLDKDELRNMMTAETWLTADEAVEKGFADLKAGEASHEVDEGETVENTGTIDGGEDIKNLIAEIGDLKQEISAMKVKPEIKNKPKRKLYL